MSALQVHQFACRDDNYCVLVHDPATGECASIDAPQEQPILDALAEKGWALTHIFVTHKHFDHVEAIEPLKKKFNCKVFAPAKEASVIPAVDVTFKDADRFKFGSTSVEVIETPGHTLGMINFFFPKEKLLFAGDTLFAIGCGRLFEGDGAMMWHSLSKLAVLDRETKIYAGHEYTLSNAKFAITVDPDNPDLIARVRDIEQLREEGKPTLPTTLDLELKTNPFLRVSDASIRKNLAMENATDAEVFTELRARKDRS